MAHKETYHRAFNSILNSILSFPILGDKYWITDIFSSENLKVGDLVSLNAVRPNDWQISWVQEISGERFLLKSAMTGELCWWSNVGFSILKESKIQTEFHWTDRQFTFRDKFIRSIQRNDDHLIAYSGIDFDGFKASCYLRKRYDFSEPDKRFRVCKIFSDFRKVKASDLNKFYLEISNKVDNSHVKK